MFAFFIFFILIGLSLISDVSFSQISNMPLFYIPYDQLVNKMIMSIYTTMKSIVAP